MVDGVYKYFLKPSKKLTESEEIPETIKVNGKERPTRNSNNKLIHTTIQGIENFWKWFGDSEVVDKRGRPLVVYHGTDKSFDTFRNKNRGLVYYFTPSAINASSYSGSTNSNIIQVYIKSENPYRGGKEEELLEAIKRGDDYYPYSLYNIKEYLYSGNPMPFHLPSTIKALKKMGYDGFVEIESNTEQYGVFSPNQIKSAIGNNGDFSDKSNKITEAAPTEQLKSMIYYHGTASKDAAMNILKNGIQAPELETKRGSQLTPVKGRVYITPKLTYAMVYAIGMSGAFGSKSYQVPYEGNEEKFKHVFSSYVGKHGGRYGYVFTIDGKDLHDIQPDEDEVGELYHIIKNKSLDYYSSRESDISVKVYEKIQKDESLQRRFVYFFERVVGEYTLNKIKQGEYAYYASGGKTALKKMSDEMKLELAQLGIHLSHGGTIIPKECWEIDKTLLGSLKEDGSNFFELAKKIS